MGVVGKSTICYKHHAKWYNFYRKYKDTLSSIFEGEADIVTQTDQIKVSPTAEEDSTTYGVHNQPSRMSAEAGTKAVGITQKICLHVSNDCITLCGFKLEDLIKYLSCPDLLNSCLFLQMFLHI